MNVIDTSLPGVKIIEPRVFGDQRGFFLETWQKYRYAEHGLPGDFVQDNLSASSYGVLRGLHHQYENTQGKLVYVLQGAVFDVAVDIRRGSPNFGEWTGVELTADNKRQLYVPPGFAHGFCVTSETVLFAYKCTDVYNPAAELSIRWDDPDLAIDWPITTPVLSDKDQQAVRLAQITESVLPVYTG
jgi:dTDP-4-dehydrorhamnose 3,5-epimerase